MVVPAPLWHTALLFNYPATTELYTLSLHDALPIYPGTALPGAQRGRPARAEHDRAELVAAPQGGRRRGRRARARRSEEHTSELQSRRDLVCRLLLEKKKKENGMDAVVDVGHSATR